MTDQRREAEIRAVIESWARAVREVDFDGILAHHTEDVLMFDVPVPVQWRGIEAYKKTWDLFFRYNPGGNGSFDLHELEVIAGETVAYAHALLDVAGSTARLTIGLKNVNGSWLIAHEHHSYAAEPE